MDAYEVIEVLKSLAKRIDPLTGAEIPLNHPYGNIKVMRAFNMAASLLEQAYINADRKKEPDKWQSTRPGISYEIPIPSTSKEKREVKPVPKKKPANAGKTWDRDEDDTLIQEYKDGNTIKQIAKNHERTVVAIESRLKRLGFMPPEYPHEEVSE